MAPGGRDPPALACRCLCGRVAVGRARACAPKAPARAARSPESGAGHHRHAPRRSPRRLRQHDRRHAEHGSARPRGRDGPARVGAGAAHAAVARLALHRALPGRTWDSRQRVAAARARACRCSPRSCSNAGSAPAPSSRRSCCRSSRDSPAGSTPTPTSSRLATTTRGSSTRSRSAATRRWPRPRRGSASPGRSGASRGCTSTIRTIRTSRRNRTRRATPAGSTTARWPGRTNWWAGSTRCSPTTGLRDDTLFVVTADHGEGLDEHGEAVHGFFVYETTLHVPLIVRGPGVTPGTRIEGRHATIDVMPTVLDLLGLAEATPAVSGRSLARGADAAAALADEPTFAESLTPLDPLRVERPPGAARRPVEIHSGAASRAVRPRIATPAKRRTSSTQEPKRARAYRSGHRAAASAGTGGAARRRTGRRGVAARHAREAGGARLRQRRRLGGARVGRGSQGQDRGVQDAQYADARRPRQPAREAIRRQPGALPGAVRPRCRQLRVALLRGPRADRPEAMARGRRPLRRGDREAAQLRGRVPRAGRRHLADGKADQALDAVRRGQKAAARRSTAHRTRRRHRAPDAAARDVAAAPTSAWRRWPRATRSCAIKLGEVYRDLGRPVGCRAADARGHPSWIRRRRRTGTRSGWCSAAAAICRAPSRRFARPRRAIARNAQYAYNLGLALERQSKREAAVAQFRRALELDPRFAPARQRLAELR